VDKRHLDVSFSIEIGVFAYFCKLKKPKLTMRSFYLLLCLFLISVVSFGQTITSAGSGFWDAPGTWVGGVVPTNINSTLVSIAAGHIITVRNTETAQGITIVSNVNSRIVISSSGQLNVSGTFTLGSVANRGRVEVSGILQMNDGSTIVNGSQQRLIIQSGGTYQMNYSTGGIVYDGDFQSGSTLEFSGYSDPSAIAPTLAVSPKSFHHVLWNCTSQGNDIDLDGILSTINGNLSITSTGPDSWFLLLSDAPAANRTITVSGNLVISNDSYVYLSGYSGGANVTMNITGNANVNIDAGYAFVLSGSSGIGTLNVNGDFGINSSSASIFMTESSGSGILNVMGNFSLTSGTLNNAGSGSAAINFNGATTNTFTNTGTISGSINYIIATLKTLNLGPSALTGTGGITLNGTIGLGSTDASGALQTGTSGGNIRVSGTRTYSSGSTIVYNGTGGQFIGNGFPSGGDVNLVINNSSNVTLSTSLDIVALRTLTLTSGNIVIGTQTLTINGTITGTGGVVGGPSSTIVIGGTGAFGTLNFNGTNQLLNLTINRGLGSINLGGDLEILGTLTLSDGALLLGSHTLSIGGDYARSNGTLDVTSSSTIIVNGSGALPIGSAGISGSALGTLTLGRVGSTLDVSATVEITNLNLLTGVLNNGTGLSIATGGTITRSEQGSMTTSPNNVANAYNVIYNITSPISTGPELPSNTTVLSNFTKQGSGALTLASDMTINGVLTLSDGSFNSGSNDIDIKGNLVSNAASTLTSSSVTFSGTTIISGSATPTFGGITISGSGSLTPSTSLRINGNLVNNGNLNAGSATTTFGGTTAISGSSVSSFNNVTVASTNTLTAPSGTMNIAGNFVNNGTFLHNNGSINFNGSTAISGSSSTSLYNTTISGIFTAPSGTLNIAGNLTNSGGTFNNNNGTLLLNGTVAAQSITGAFTLNNVNVSNPSKVNNNGNIDLNGTLSLVSAGQFDADGAGAGIFVIKSSSVTAGGRIAALTTPANFSGTVTVERFINGPDSWRYLSMPITNGNAGTWQANFPVTGNFSNPSPNGVNGVVSSTAASITLWNAATQAYVNVGSGGTTASTSLNNLVGYSAYTYLSGDFTISATGTARTGNATVPVSTGFNLVPNPYPSPVDWDNINRTGFSNTVYIRVANNVFASYVAGGVAINEPFIGWTGEIATGQAFWVESTGATSLNLTESAKSGNQYQFLREGEPSNLLRIALSSSNQRDETIIWFPVGASNDFDNSFDASKMRNGYYSSEDEKGRYINIATLGGTKEYAINGLGKLSCDNSTKLLVADVDPGIYTLSFQGLESMDLGYRVVLVDRYNKLEKDITEGTDYEFSVTEDATSFGADRFEIRFIIGGNTWINSQTPPHAELSNFCSNEVVTLTVVGQRGASYQLLLDGSPISDEVIGIDQSSLKFDILRQVLKAGQNSIDLVVKSLNGCGQFTFADIASFDNQNLNPPVITRDGFMLLSNVASDNEWMLDGIKIDGAIEKSLSITKSGVYSVTISSGVCSLSSNELLVEFDDSEIQTYPNPSTDRVFITLPSEVNKKVSSISLLDSRGVKIFDDVSNPEILLGDVKVLDLSSVEPGLYILNILADRRHVIKIIKK
jgi:hypothetical protein